MTQRYAELRSLRPFYTEYNRVFRGVNRGFGACGNVRGYWHGDGHLSGNGLGIGYGNGFGEGFGFGKSPGLGSVGRGHGEVPMHWLRGVV